MLQAAVQHRFTDGETAEAHFTGADLDEILAQLRARFQEWDTDTDDVTNIQIMTARINGHA